MVADRADMRTDEIVFGAVLMLAAAIFCATGRVVAAITATHRESDAAFDAGFEMGMDKGYKEGRRAGRPMVVTDLRIPKPQVESAPYPRGWARGAHSDS
jgi:hypothetical protein